MKFDIPGTRISVAGSFSRRSIGLPATAPVSTHGAYFSGWVGVGADAAMLPGRAGSGHHVDLEKKRTRPAETLNFNWFACLWYRHRVGKRASADETCRLVVIAMCTNCVWTAAKYSALSIKKDLTFGGT